MIQALLTVDIETGNGVFSRSSLPFQVTDSVINIEGGTITYPDKRVKNFRLHASNDGITWYYKEYKSIQAGKSNFAYAIIGDTITVDGTIANFGTATTQSAISLRTSGVEHDPNRVLVSTPYKPRQLYGRNALYIGNSSDDEVLTFKANAKAVSLGQFGQYPLYAFCKNSIWAMEVGTGDVAFSRVSAVSINEGIINKHAAVNIDTMIAYATNDGIKTIPEQDQPLSFPIQNSDSHYDILARLNDNTRMAFLLDKVTGRRELWVATDELIYVYSFSLRRWFTLSGMRTAFTDVDGVLTGCQNGTLYKEAGTVANRTGIFQTAPVVFGDQDTIKKFRRIMRRSAVNAIHPSGYTVYITNHTDYEYLLSEDGITDTVFSVDFEYEERYAHRMRLRRNDVDQGFYGGYGGTYQEIYQ
jgi:hypothetical protein